MPDPANREIAALRRQKVSGLVERGTKVIKDLASGIAKRHGLFQDKTPLKLSDVKGSKEWSKKVRSKSSTPKR